MKAYRRRTVLLAGAACCATLGLSGQVQAQAADQPTPRDLPANQPLQPQSTATDQTAPQTNGLADIVVTAQRRTESLQRAGIAVDVVGGATLTKQGLSAPTDLGKLVPSLNVQSGGGANTIFFLRGVGNFTVNGYSDPAIAFNYDGVYLGRPTSTSGIFYDVDRLEVLKGPQGTLYGRNATAGAINVIPTQPKIGETSGYLTGSYGNYDAINLQGAINLPMGEDGALRISGNLIDRKGYLTDGLSDEKIQSLRVQMKAHLTPDLTIRVTGDYSHTGGRGAGATYLGAYSYNRTTARYDFTPSGLAPEVGFFDPAAQAYRQKLFLAQAGRNAAPLAPDIYQDNSYFGTAATIEWNTGAGTLTVIPAWRSAKLNNKYGTSGFIGYIQQKDEQFSLEARFNGRRIGIFDYIIGGFLFDESIRGNYTFAQQVLNSYQNFQSDTHSYAVFGRLTANITDRFRAIGGIRYTDDRKQFVGEANVFILRCTVVVAGRPSCPTVPLMPTTDNFSELPSPYVIPPSGQARPIGTTGAILARATTPVNARLPKSKVTYRAGLEFDVAARSLAYASIETGFRSGGFALAAGYETFQPEYLTAYTIGLKNRFLDNRVQFNVEAFLWKYSNQQVSHNGVDANGNQGVFTENVGRSTSKGIEADLQLLATRSTLLNATVQYLDARYDSFRYLEPVGTNPPLTGCPATRTATAPARYQIDCSNFPAYQSPKWTINLGARQTITLGSYELVPQIDTQYKSSRYIAFNYLPQQLQGPTWTTNAQVSFGPANGAWSVAGYVRNIEGNRYMTGGTLNNNLLTFGYIAAPPRTYGVRGTVNF